MLHTSHLHQHAAHHLRGHGYEGEAGGGHACDHDVGSDLLDLQDLAVLLVSPLLVQRTACIAAPMKLCCIVVAALSAARLRGTQHFAVAVQSPVELVLRMLLDTMASQRYRGKR